MLIKKSAKIILNNLIALKKNIKIDTLNHMTSPKTLLKLPKYKNKIIINKASLSGDLIIGEGCKFLNELSCSSKLELGRFVSVNGPSTRLASKINEIKIGSFTSIASNTIIQEYYHKYDRISTYYMNNNIFDGKVDDDIYSKGDIVIGEDVWIGSNSVVLSGVNIGRGAIIGAGSVVTKDIPPYVIAAGNPAKALRKRFSKEVIELLEEIKWWNWDVDKIKRNKDIFNYNEKKLINNKVKLLELV